MLRLLGIRSSGSPALLRLTVGLALASTASSQLITYESLADGKVWTPANASAFGTTSSTSSHFGETLDIRAANLTRLEITRAPLVLSAGTYRATIWMRGRGGLVPIRLTASPAGYPKTTVETPTSAQRLLAWQCARPLSFEIPKATTVWLTVHNRDSSRKPGYQFDSFVLERVSGGRTLTTELLEPAAGTVSSAVASGANPFCFVRQIRTATRSSHIFQHQPRTYDPGGYACTARLRKTVSSAGRVDVRVFNLAGNANVKVDAANQPVGQWFWTPEIPFTVWTRVVGSPSVIVQGAGYNYEIGEIRITRRAEAAPALYYKFDRSLGDVVVNYGTSSERAQLKSKGGSPWAASALFGEGALRGAKNTTGDDYAYCDTNFKRAIQGDLTIHWWMKQRVDPGAGVSDLWGRDDGFHCRASGSSLYVQLRKGDPPIELPTSGASFLQRARSANGLFVTFVVRGRFAFWFLDGKLHGGPRTISVPNIPYNSAASLKIGQRDSAVTSSCWDLDEFRLLNRGASDEEILLWSGGPTAAAGAFGTARGISLGTVGTPVVGNPNYTHRFIGRPNMRYLFVIGARTQPPFDMGIAFPQLRGSRWFVEFTAQIPGSTGGSSTGTIRGGIPADYALAGSSVETQVLGLVGSTFYMSNAVSHRIEID